MEKVSPENLIYHNIYLDKDKWIKAFQKAIAKVLEKEIEENGKYALEKMAGFFKARKSKKKAVAPEAGDIDWNDPWVRQNQTLAGLIQARFDVQSPQVQEFISNTSYRLSFDINEQTQRNLRQGLETAFSEGESIPKIRNRVKEALGFSVGERENYRATRIARTESIRASNYGTLRAWEDSGVIQGKQWFTSEDERTCPFCESLNGIVINSLDGNFKRRGERISVVRGPQRFSMLLDYEDIKAPPLHPNCRCVLLSVIKDEYKEEDWYDEFAEYIVATEDEGPPPEEEVSGVESEEASFSNSDIAEEESIGAYTLNGEGVRKVTLENGEKGYYKWEEAELRSLLVERYYRQTENMADFRGCSMTKREVLAYDIDKLLDVNLIPETVWKESQRLNRSGSLMREVPGFQDASTYGFRKQLRNLAETQGPQFIKNEFARMATFDDLLANIDRHKGNFGIGADNKFYFIDNGTTFAYYPEKAWNGVFLKSGGRDMIADHTPVGPTKNFRKTPEYIATGKVIAQKAIANTDSINESFVKVGLSQSERMAFWRRVQQLRDGTFFEYDERRTR